jgi:hypothetical protein
MGKGAALTRLMAVMSGLAIGPCAAACTVCDSEQSRALRAALLDESFASNLGAVLAPFLVFGLIGGAVHFGVPRPRFTARAARK